MHSIDDVKREVALAQESEIVESKEFLFKDMDSGILKKISISFYRDHTLTICIDGEGLFSSSVSIPQEIAVAIRDALVFQLGCFRTDCSSFDDTV